MKTFSKTDFANLEKELRDNEAAINKLEVRNKQIRNAFQALHTLVGLPKPSVQRTARAPSSLKGKLQKGSVGERVMEILKDGAPMDVWAIARKFYNREPTQKETDAVANICSSLYRIHGKTRRISRGVYQTNFPEVTKQTASIGEDTRITNIHKRELLPEMQPSRHREVTVIKGNGPGF